MSIINEALKKTQSEFSEKEGQDVSNLYEKLHTKVEPETDKEPGTKTPEARPQLPSSSQIPILLIIFVLLVGVFVATRSTETKKSSSSTKPINPIKKIASLIHVPKPTPQPKSIPKQVYKKGELVLNGTMKVDHNKTVALINNEIYQVGDSIDGKQIMSITMEGVELTDKGKTIFLTVKGP